MANKLTKAKRRVVDKNTNKRSNFTINRASKLAYLIMRLSKFCKENQVSFSLVKLLLGYLELNTSATLNTKFPDRNIEFLKTQLVSKEFEEYYSLLLKSYEIKKQNRQNVFNKWKSNSSLSDFEKILVLRTIVSLLYSQIKEEENLKYILLKNDYSDEDFSKIFEYYNKYEFEEIKNDTTETATTPINSEMEKIIKKYFSEDDRDEHIEDYDETIRDWNGRRRKSNGYVEDYEEKIMRALADGEGEKYGF